LFLFCDRREDELCDGIEDPVDANQRGQVGNGDVRQDFELEFGGECVQHDCRQVKGVISCGGVVSGESAAVAEDQAGTVVEFDRRAEPDDHVVEDLLRG